jgi:eukaryotic-like serine/threonine-protein kinase
MPAPIDTTLPPRYRDARLVARGGMGEVYSATDTELGRVVAVKVLSARYLADESLRQRFRREALAAARLSGNPSIVTVFDVAEHEGRPMIVMELLPGGSLEQRIAGKAPLPPEEVLSWLDQAATALDAAHAAGIVHRDVKPGNLLFDERGHVKVADFGIASATGLDSFTHTGTILGTAGYLSPEQARGERASAASDRYSLAVVAWELLAGARPYAADSTTAEAAAHIHASVPSISTANPRLPRELDAVFARALAKDPAERPATAEGFVEELRDALTRRETWDEPPTRVVAPSRPQRRRFVPVLAVLLLLAAAGAVAALLTTRGGDTTASVTVVHTVTRSGTTVERTVTTQQQQQQPTSTAETGGASGAALNDAGYAKMRGGDYAGALPLLEQAVAKLQGTGQTTEAYADYNLAYTRRALGSCTDVLGLLDRSQQIQGHRKEIDRLRHEARKQC